MRLLRDKRNIPLAEDTNVYFFTSINIVSNKKYKDTSKHTTPHHNTSHHTTPHHSKAKQYRPLSPNDEVMRCNLSVQYSMRIIFAQHY